MHLKISRFQKQEIIYLYDEHLYTDQLIKALNCYTLHIFIHKDIEYNMDTKLTNCNLEMRIVKANLSIKTKLVDLSSRGTKRVI